jgi:hypothetical protein
MNELLVAGSLADQQGDVSTGQEQVARGLSAAEIHCVSGGSNSVERPSSVLGTL